MDFEDIIYKEELWNKKVYAELLERPVLQGVSYVWRRFTTYFSLNWLEISKSTLDMKHAYMWTTFTSKIITLG
jgi:hypothetical protein